MEMILSEKGSKKRKEVIAYGFSKLAYKMDPSYVVGFLRKCIAVGIGTNRIKMIFAKSLEWNQESGKAIRYLESESGESFSELQIEIEGRARTSKLGMELSINPGKVESYSKASDSILYCVNSCLPYITSGYTIRSKKIIEEISKIGVDVSVCVRPGFPNDRADIEVEQDLGDLQVNGTFHSLKSVSYTHLTLPTICSV